MCARTCDISKSHSLIPEQLWKWLQGSVDWDFRLNSWLISHSTQLIPALKWFLIILASKTTLLSEQIMTCSFLFSTMPAFGAEARVTGTIRHLDLSLPEVIPIKRLLEQSHINGGSWILFIKIIHCTWGLLIMKFKSFSLQLNLNSQKCFTTKDFWSNLKGKFPNVNHHEAFHHVPLCYYQ